MDLIYSFVDFVLHIDKHLIEIVGNYHVWTYLLLFAIIFCETGFVVTPFLPGDSLLFAAGTISALDGNPLNITMLLIILLIAAFGGDNTNYWIGRAIGQKVYEKDYKLINRKNLNKTHDFYEKHGGKTLIIARFMPIVRTFAPFIAGVGKMTYKQFLLFSGAGNIIWVGFFLIAGYFFGNIPFVKNNFSLVIILIILISVMPPVVVALKQKFAKE